MDTNDVVSLSEVQEAFSTSDDTNLALTITAVSQLLDEQCGPIVARSVTSVREVCGAGYVDVGGPIDSVLSVTTDDWTLDDYTLFPKVSGTGTYTGTIGRDNGLLFTGTVTVVATQGRYTSTESVHPKFKLAAIDIIRNLWRANEIGVGPVGDYDMPYPTFPASYAIPNAVRDLLGEDWNGRRDNDAVGVMWG